MSFGDVVAPRWVASRHNFDPAIAVEPRPVELHDLTLRDGEEAADLAYTTPDKVKLAESLALIWKSTRAENSFRPLRPKKRLALLNPSTCAIR